MYNFLEKIVYETHDITKKNVGIINEEGNVVAFSDLKKINSIKNVVTKNFNFKNKEGEFNKYSFVSLNLENEKKCFIFIEGTNEESLNYLKILRNLISNTYNKRNFQYERENFIKRVLTNNIYYKELEILSKNYNIKLNENFVVVLFEISEKATEEIFNFFKNLLKSDSNFPINLDFTNFVLIKKINNFNEEKSLEKYLIKIVKTIKETFQIDVIVGVSEIKYGFRNISKSYEEAKTAIKIKKMFNSSEEILKYEKLGLKRLIYKLPIDVCEVFLKEILKKEKIDNLDKETLFTVKKFFENNLNISETARKMFIHRNTLVYRLEKIKSKTGLDLKDFEQATKFKLALMVQKYLNFVFKNDVKIYQGENRWFIWKMLVLDMINITTF